MNTVYEKLIVPIAHESRFVCWRGTNKVPLNAASGRNASVADAATWSDAATCRAFFTRDAEGGGIGVVFTRDARFTRLVGVDLDDCLNAHGAIIRDDVREFVDMLDSLTVVSASGTGLHVYLRVDDNRALADVVIKNRHVARNADGLAFAMMEIYDDARYFRVARSPIAFRDADVRCVGMDTITFACTFFDNLDEYVESAIVESRKPARFNDGGGGDSVISQYNRARSVADLLARFGYHIDKRARYFTRPHKNPRDGVSGMINDDGSAYSFSVNDAMRQEKNGHVYTFRAFDVLCSLGHDGDVRTAVSAAARELGMQHTPRAFGISDLARVGTGY